MVNHFGEVRNFVMGLSDIGYITAKYFQKIPNHFPNVRLDEWVVMPNHVHGIIIIDKPQNDKISTVEAGDGGGAIDKPQNDKISTVGTRHGASLRNEGLNKFGPLKANSLSSIINQFKGAVKRWCNKNGHSNFQWQSRFYDHIITNDKELLEIREYIYYNPQMWDRDRNNKLTK
ncbi:transposase [Candidatus Peregrinibacteria bacterium]|nr:transposase [Candidatus Peregrinibacteria bacterium]